MDLELGWGKPNSSASGSYRSQPLPQPASQSCLCWVLTVRNTFKSSPPQFEQLWVVLVQIEGVTLPVVYALLENRTECSYVAVLRFIEQRCPSFDPTVFMVDFEGAEHNAVLKVWGSRKIQGCIVWRSVSRGSPSCVVCSPASPVWRLFQLETSPWPFGISRPELGTCTLGRTWSDILLGVRGWTLHVQVKSWRGARGGGNGCHCCAVGARATVLAVWRVSVPAATSLPKQPRPSSTATFL